MRTSEIPKKIAPTIEKLARKRDVAATAALAWLLFGVRLTPGQARIAWTVAFLPRRRVVVSAHTRYGKTFAVAVGLALLLILHPRPIRIRAIGPTEKQAEILRTYFVNLVTKSPITVHLLGLDLKRGAERLKKELSKRRLVFRDGKEFAVLSANPSGSGGVGAVRAGRLMGEGADVVVLDESCLILEEVFRSKILRMLGDDGAGGHLIELSNPWHAGNHFYRHFNDGRRFKIHVGWRLGVEEGRITPAFVEEQREELTPAEFQVLMESVFPDASEDALIPWAWIEATHDAPKLVGDDVRVRYSLDVSEGGGDSTVLWRIRWRGPIGKEEFDVELVATWKGVEDTALTTERVADRMEPGAVVIVDAIGVGKGVADHLRDLHGFKVVEFKASEKARDAKRFANVKAEAWWTVRRVLERRAARLPRHDVLRSDLARMKFDTSTGKVRVWEEGSKSPDFGDALAIGLWSKGSAPRLRYS